MRANSCQPHRHCWVDKEGGSEESSALGIRGRVHQESVFYASRTFTKFTENADVPVECVILSWRMKVEYQGTHRHRVTFVRSVFILRNGTQASGETNGVVSIDQRLEVHKTTRLHMNKVLLVTLF